MMLNFERGSLAKPRGHAIAYFHSATNPDEVYATYLVVPPISIDLAKYMPPMFSGKFPLADMDTVSAIPLPPVPEKIQSLSYLKMLAEGRDDDVIDLGITDVADVQGLLTLTADASQEYLRSYQVFLVSQPMPVEGEKPAIDGGDTVNDVLFSLMGERDRLSELAKLLGKMRYATDSNDKSLVGETQNEIDPLAKHMPSKYHIDKVIAAAKQPGDRGRKLLELQLMRCYKLCDEDYRAVESLESQIRDLEAQGK